MNKKLYKLMNWAAIEEIIYSECSNPQKLLGPHAAGNGTLIQAYFPGAASAGVKWLSADPLVGDCVTEMELADEDGYFAVILPEKKVTNYSYMVTYEHKNDDGTITKSVKNIGDAYRHNRILQPEIINCFSTGILMDAYRYFGSHKMNHMGEDGVYFSVWAPNAMRVSVVGDFNNWDGRINQMIRLEDGVFEIFVPGVNENAKYRFEIKLKGDRILLKNDPYASCYIDNYSVVAPSEVFKWKDAEYVKKTPSCINNPLIFEVSPEYFNNSESAYKKQLTKLIKEVKSSGYNFIQIKQSSETSDISIPHYLFNNRNIFAVDDNLKKLVDAAHENEIGVIFEFDPSGFAGDDYGMANFDGTCLYEHQNPKQGRSADGKRYLYQYGRPEVISFLTSAGLWLVKEFHADGLCFTGVAQMLYLDYGKNEGEWIPNVNGGNENLEAIEFIKHFNILLKENAPRTITFAEDSSVHGGMTTGIVCGGLGFNYKWNEGFTSEYFDYMSYDPIERSEHHSQLLDETVYSFAERFVLPLSGQLTCLSGMPMDMFPGSDGMKKNSIKLSIAYAYMHPGFKLISDRFYDISPKLCMELNRIYCKEPALCAGNENPDSFEWLSNMNASGCYISFIRKTEDPEEMILAVANFAGIEQTIKIGVPYEGKYQEIINTDSQEYGGSGIVNKDVMYADNTVCDGRAQSIELKIAPISLSIIKFDPYTESELAKVIEERIRKYTPIKKNKR